MPPQTTKLQIAHPNENGCNIVGLLNQHTPSSAGSTQGRKIALILHGAMGHKDYLFLKGLAQQLPIDSFRFDFRGAHETGGTWKIGNLVEDVQDIEAVAQWLVSTYGYVIDLVIGHSRGSIVGMYWTCTSPLARDVHGFVNASGRYRNELIKETPTGKLWPAAFESKGYFDWTVKVARKEIHARAYPRDVENFATWNTGIVWDHFPPTVDVLTLHGLKDFIVPSADAVIYARALGSRTPGTHTLYLMEHADHNFTGMSEIVIDSILKWWQMHESGRLKTGVWETGVRGKL